MATRKTKKKPAGAPDEAEETLSFEDSMTRLTQIVEELEQGDLTLEESLKRFEEGVGLARSSQTRLDSAEARVEQLLGVERDGTLITEELEMT